MSMLRMPGCWALAGLLVLAPHLSAGERECEQWIEELLEVDEPGYGYSVYFSGSEFLPYEDTGHVTTLVLGAGRAARSDTLRKLVEQGIEAIPTLLKHIGDDRPLNMKPVSGMMWMSFSEEYDFNRRTRKPAPQGVNRDDLAFGPNEPQEHAVTIGDLCFVALGQIVNRSFSATRYQPTGGMVVSSPTHSAALKKVILDDWTGVTKERHKALLIEDFLKPDFEDRRIGAYLRLAYYYPEAVEKRVLDELSRPSVDSSAIWTFRSETLFQTRDKADRRRKYDQFIRQHGERQSAGVMHQLFDDLETLEAHERGEPTTPFVGSSPRELLIELFNKPADVRSADRPDDRPASDSERARLIRMLIHDDSQKIGDAVKKLFFEKADDDYFSPACLRCLASRGYAEFLTEQLDKVDLTAPELSYLHAQWIEAASSSREPAVRDKLLQIVNNTSHEAYFMAALPAIDRSDDPLVFVRARRLLANLPKNTKDGETLLQMLGDRFPSEAKAVYQSFIANGSAQRAATMCNVLWYGHPLACEILAPMLDDKRELAGFSIPIRVCDRAAQAISHSIEQIRFDEEWDEARRDRQIEKIKQFCKENPKQK
ncbi:MAG TPA: hypothetical protein VMV10_11150 [Pirellulales bacterium]|nr:hypothetical protein [Pirellulales bacterium]